MRTYLIGYDLKKPGKDYTTLIAGIKQLGDWWHYLDSTWIVKTNSSASDIRDELKPLIDPNDQLLVVRLQGDWASWLNVEGNDWLSENLTLE